MDWLMYNRPLPESSFDQIATGKFFNAELFADLLTTL
jgi:hypothetical protein